MCLAFPLLRLAVMSKDVLVLSWKQLCLLRWGRALCANRASALGLTVLVGLQIGPAPPWKLMVALHRRKIAALCFLSQCTMPTFVPGPGLLFTVCHRRAQGHVPSTVADGSIAPRLGFGAQGAGEEHVRVVEAI